MVHHPSGMLWSIEKHWGAMATELQPLPCAQAHPWFKHHLILAPHVCACEPYLIQHMGTATTTSTRRRLAWGAIHVYRTLPAAAY
jgi:hypothetical protein